MLTGLALIFASGVLLMLTELDTFAVSAVFWTKMGLLATGWRRFRRTSVASLVLWFLILLAGTLLHATT